MDKAGLVAEIEESRAVFMAEIARIPAEQMEAVALYGVWSPKDLLGHIAFWERRAASLMSALLAGQTPAKGQDVDELNAGAYQASHSLPLEAIRREEAGAYQDLMALVETLPEDTLASPARFTWLDGAPLVELALNNTSGHYAEHLPDLKTWIGTLHLRR